MEQQGNSARSIEDNKPAETTPLPAQPNASPPQETEPVNPVNETTPDKTAEKKTKSSDRRREKHQEGKGRRKDAKSRRRTAHQESGSSDDSDDVSSYDSDSSDSSSAGKRSKKNTRRRRIRRVSSGKLSKSSRATSKRHKRRSRNDSDSALSSDSSSDSDRETEARVVRENDHSGSDTDKEVQNLRRQIQQLQQQVALQPAMVSPFYPNMLYPFHPFDQHPPNPFRPAVQVPGLAAVPPTNPPPPPPPQHERPAPPRVRRTFQRGIPVEIEEEKKKDKSRAKKDGKPSFRRVDFVWDSSALCFKIRDTTDTQSQDDEDDDNIFLVRRTFDTQGRYRQTFVDIRSKLLRECLKDTIGEVKGVTFVEETPKLDPDFLFLYMDDLLAHYKHLKTVKPTGDSKKEKANNAKKIGLKIAHLKLLLKYLRKDYAEIKRQVDSLLRNGLITFELLWALWKPKSLVYTTTFGNDDEPRVFRVESVERHVNMQKGEYFHIDGKYFEYDGKNFGYGSMASEIGSFRGARKITSLPCYPLHFHRDEAGLRKRLIERGKKFVELRGVHYKSYSGMAYLKSKKHGVIKFNVQQSRVMVDTKTFRRINPNYMLSPLGHAAHGSLPPGSMSDDEDDSDCNSCGSDVYDSDNGQLEVLTTVYKDGGGEGAGEPTAGSSNAKGESSDSCGKTTPSSSVVDADGKGDKAAGTANKDGAGSGDDALPRALTDEDYILASPVVLGFAFAEKQWLEFSVANISEVKWNDQAWDSLVLEPTTKDLIKALVTSRRNHASRTVDDVIQGKGKGLVTVLHGAPGTGKTLTAEGISELLRCPLYVASAGELGTDSRYLEAELQRLLDVCHAWGAVLLLDEADVFLERRNVSDVHRNALVSVFLRQLEYFQGILFLTTNRVETFDEAFQSRIHIALRYDKLDAKARRKIMAMFLGRVRALGTIEVDALDDDDLARLVRQDLNGREIKNVVSSAQDLAMSKEETLGMKHLLQVLEVHAKFSRDLKGGTGYEDAMRSYF
ncbi:ATPase, AAA-type, core [Cordyceps fumosorosea ARSEF 2679]|uniref:ATPase, AAA-type, core n=1 Tax=Cordyceps fumosorosea (strain ARSEF 2679) TaxID=1081104 RepID=A0A168BPN5_CORFA|nr:ATPase, AAA-type, core [Cordyceps fumosorosea ARSEF 2679]OAA70388.1 ATPase, AAA-type, core [Cordyceps fumosorosea ARSEF 2679]